jgi:hypothetical protein
MMTGEPSQTDRAPLQLPAAVRAALDRSARPVRPILPALPRTIAVGLMALAFCAAAVLVHGVRADAAELGLARLWLPALMRLAAGVCLIHLALRSAQPAGGPSRRLQLAGALLAPILLAVLAEWLSPGAGPQSSLHSWLVDALGCYPLETAIALPAAILLGWLLARAYPLRPVFTAAIGAAGAGVIADAAMHLTCPVRAWTHTLLVHGAAVATVSLAAALLGLVTLRSRFRAP